jgi:hypothetical protein
MKRFTDAEIAAMPMDERMRHARREIHAAIVILFVSMGGGLIVLAIACSR